MAPRKDLRVVLVLELTRASTTSEDQPWGVTTSIGGRDGTYTVRWGRPGLRLNGGELDDMVGWITERVTNAIVMTEGLQGELL